MLVLTACGGSGDDKTVDKGAADDDAAAAATDIEAGLAGRYGELPTEPNPAPEGKSVWVVVSGLASPTASNAARDFEAAADLLGWETNVFDGQLDPGNWIPGIRQALAAGVDGIVVVGIDCPAVKSGLEEAKDAEVPVVGFYSMDCSEIDEGAESLMTQVSFGDRYADYGELFRGWGADAASWIINDNKGAADVISVSNQEYNILKFYQDGFDARMDDCATCSLTQVDYLATEFGAVVQGKLEAALVSAPEANGVQATVDPSLGPIQAIQASGRADDLAVVGGFGLASDFDALRAGTLDAVAAWPGEWWAYAVTDTMISAFNGTEPRDGGVGWQVIDADHSLPAEGEDFVADQPYVDSYKTSWGVN
jgi:ribose transport system substrate-binding protein